MFYSLNIAHFNNHVLTQAAVGSAANSHLLLLYPTYWLLQQLQRVISKRNMHIQFYEVSRKPGNRGHMLTIHGEIKIKGLYYCLCYGLLRLRVRVRVRLIWFWVRDSF